MKAKILITLLAIVAAAGCTIPSIPGITPGTTVIGGGKGLDITSFTATPTTTYSGSTVTLSMGLSNDGGTTTTNTTSFAYLPDVDVGSTDNTTFHGTGTDLLGSSCKSLGDIKTADVVKGTSGGTKTVKWSLRAPDYPSGQVIPTTITGRVYYDYLTSVYGNVWVYNETESEAVSATGKTLNKASFTSTSGPITLDVSVSPDPVVESGDNTFTLNIKISNNGGGTVYKSGKSYSSCSPPPSTTDLNIVTVNVVPPPSFTNDPTCINTDQDLTSGSTTLTCTIIAAGVTTFRSYPITVTAKYGYYTDQTISVTIQGKSTSSTPTPSCTGPPNICPSLGQGACNTCGCTWDGTTSTCGGNIPCSSLDQVHCVRSACDGCIWG